MSKTDLGFPIIEYKLNQTPFERGVEHGKLFKDAITELAQIRKNLMLAKNPKLSNDITRLALEQLDISKKFAPEVTKELEGIATGAELPLEDIVILNNYTDFRDIQLPDEGCSTIYKKTETLNMSGQTWDMHSSAKRFVCVIKLPKSEKTPGAYIFSLVGCVGMMGINTHDVFIGVNNINTLNAKVGLIWPVLVRKSLEARSLDDMRDCLKNSPVTSGHNYLISDINKGEHWEISPDFVELVKDSSTDKDTYHTNHCLGKDTQTIEDKNSISSTTFPRFEILERRFPKIENQEEFIGLLKDHEGYPKSICSHFESGAQDPSMTCGGATYNYKTQSFHMWRGCEEYDDNYVEYTFSMREL